MFAQRNELQERKRQLLARSEACRTSIINEFQNIKTAAAWLPRTIRTARALYPVLLLAVPLIGYIFARKRSAPPQNHAPTKRGLIASPLAGYRFYRQIKPVWDKLRSRSG